MSTITQHNDLSVDINKNVDDRPKKAGNTWYSSKIVAVQCGRNWVHDTSLVAIV